MSRLIRTTTEQLLRPGSPISNRVLRIGRPSSTRALTEFLETNVIQRPSTPCPSSKFPSPVSKIPGSFYRRELPNDLISFTSQSGRQLFKECLDSGTIENYFNLVGNFTTQSETSYCGLGSLAMVLNALEVDPGRNWKGVWRWYSDEMLECCSPLEIVKEKGITFDQFVCLAKCHGLDPLSNRHDQTSFEQFESDLLKCSSEPGIHMVISFSRQAMGQTGIGHFSPVGAFHKEKQMALIMDVARFKYPSYWAPISKLWNAMEPVDPDTGVPRGYIMLKQASPRITGCP